MRVSVPVRKDDTDVAIKNALDVASTLLAERRALRARVDALEKQYGELLKESNDFNEALAAELDCAWSYSAVLEAAKVLRARVARLEKGLRSVYNSGASQYAAQLAKDALNEVSP